MSRAKNALVSEFRDAMGNHEQLLVQALNEAEAIAWQTDFPQLIFPTLAREKVEAAALWHRQQRRVHAIRTLLAPAA